MMTNVRAELARAAANLSRTRQRLAAAREATAVSGEARHVREELVEDTHHALGDLRLAVRAYVAALRAGGTPPERALVLLKEGLEEQSALGKSLEAVALKDEVTRWFIDAFYAA
jgi:hypothetical protein